MGLPMRGESIGMKARHKYNLGAASKTARGFTLIELQGPEALQMPG
jgi:hypothetical protein